MKKIIAILTIALTLTLTGCGEDPFEVPKDGYHLIETDTFTLTHNNGVEETEVFSYTFSQSYYMFTKDEMDVNEVHYDFTNINNYQALSDDFKAFIDSFDLIEIEENKGNYSDKIEFSTGATEGDYHFETLEITGDSYDVYANITTSNGVLLRLTYTVFDTEVGILYIPSYVVIETVDLHQSTHYNFLAEPNEYDQIDVAIVDYVSTIVALPPRTAYELQYETLKHSDIVNDDYFQRIYTHELNLFGEYDVCLDGETEDCVEQETFSLQAQTYNATISDVQSFYINNFRGNFDSESFYFISDNTTYRITDFEEVQVTTDSGERITVVNMTIDFY